MKASTAARGLRIGRWAGLLLLLLGVLELVLHLWFRGRAPDLEAWRGVRDAVQEVAGPGTLVVVSPEWAEPMARAALGSELMPLEHLARPDNATFDRALEVSILGGRATLPGFEVGEAWEVGAFTLRRWANPSPSLVHFDFVDSLLPGEVEVTSRRGDRPRTCNYQRAPVSNGDLHGHPTFPRQRFVCGGGDWHFVGVTVIEDEQYRPRRCIWAHPTGRQALSIRFHKVPWKGRIVGYAGLPYFFEREGKGAPVQLELLSEAGSLGRWEHRDGEGWKRFEFDLPSGASSGWVEFQVTTSRAYRREFCFYAQVRE